MSDQVKIGIVAFGFGEPANLKSNEQIAAQVKSLVSEVCLELIITDRDVAPHLSGSASTVSVLDEVLFPHTYRMAVFAVKHAQKHRVDELHVVAAPCHMWRALRDLRWVVKELGSEITFVLCPARQSLYDRKATTWYTRSAWFWWPLELAYRAASSIFPEFYKRCRA